MPVKCKYTNRETGQLENIDTLNQLMQEDTQATEENVKAFMPYNTVSLMGIAVLMTQGGCEITAEKFEKWCENFGKDINPNLIKAGRRFLYKEYKFEAWR